MKLIGAALEQVAQALDLPKNEVPRKVFYDFEDLGSISLGVDADRLDRRVSDSGPGRVQSPAESENIPSISS